MGTPFNHAVLNYCGMANQTESNRSTVLMGKATPLAGPELKAGDKAPDFEVIDGKFQTVNLAGTGPGVRILSVVPSLDTPVCDAQTKRFEDEAAKMSDVKIYTVSMDLPFAQKRWCGNYGILIPDMRIESRAIFVIDANNDLKHVEYVPEVASHPNYEAALAAAREALRKQ